MEATTVQKPLKVGSVVRITKGCSARNLRKYDLCRVLDVQPLGAEYGHFVKVVLRTNGNTLAFYARHMNRLSAAEVTMNDGNPLNRIKVRVEM